MSTKGPPISDAIAQALTLLCPRVPCGSIASASQSKPLPPNHGSDGQKNALLISDRGRKRALSCLTCPHRPDSAD